MSAQDTERDVIVEHRPDGSLAVTVIIPPGNVGHAVYDCIFDQVGFGATVKPADKRKPMVLLNAHFQASR